MTHQEKNKKRKTTKGTSYFLAQKNTFLSSKVGLRNQILINTVGLINHNSIPNVGLINHTPTRCGLMNQIPKLKDKDRPFHKKVAYPFFLLLTKL